MNKIHLAPMAGFTDVGFRHVAKLCGAGITYTEMVSAKGSVYGNKNTELLLLTSPLESPLAVQLFGAEPEFFARAAAHPLLQKFDIIDINMGCPVNKIVKNGEGAALLNDVRRAAAIVQATVKHARPGVSVSIKMRVGYDPATDAKTGFTPSGFARAMQDAGAAAIGVHGRTREQFYSGAACRAKIAEAVAAVSVPVTANGDVTGFESAQEMLAQTGAHAVMIGRAALGNPKVFLNGTAQAEDETQGGRYTLKQLIDIHISVLERHFPERAVVGMMKGHLCQYSKSKEIRRAVGVLSTLEELKLLVNGCF